MRPPFSKAGLFSLLFVAAALRFWSLHWGAPPQIAAADELYHAEQAVRIFHEPRAVFHEPYTPLYDRFVSLLLTPGRILQGPPRVTAGVFFLGRALSALCDIVGVAVTFFLGLELFGSAAIGFAGAALHALCFEALKHSKYMTPDTLATLLALLTLWAGLRFSRAGGRRLLVVSGMLTAAATAAKFNNCLLLAALVPLVIQRKDASKNAGLLIFSFLLTLPFFFPSLIPFIKEVLLANRNLARPGEPFKLTCEGGALAMFLHNYAIPHEEMSTRSLWGAMGWLPGALGLAGLAFGLTRRSLWPVALFALLTLLAAARLNIVRYALPAYPLMGLLGAGLLFGGIRSPRLYTFGLILLCAQPLWKAVRYDARLAREDTRLAAGRWIESHIEKGTTVALYRSHLWSNPALSTGDFNLVNIPFALYSSEGLRDDRARPLSYYRDQQVRYLIVNSYMMGHHLNPASEAAFPETCRSYAEFYASLGKEAALAFECLKKDGDRPGPDIRIYRL